MPKRRRGYQPPHRTAPLRCRPIRRADVAFEALVERALAGIPPPFDRALDEVAIVIADLPTREELRENGLDPDEMLYGLYEGTPRTEWGADDGPIPEQDHALPPAARGGLPESARPRGGGPGDGHPRAGAPPGHRRRPPARAGPRVALRRPCGSVERRRPVELRPLVDHVRPEDHEAGRRLEARHRPMPEARPQDDRRSRAAPGTTGRTRRPRRGPRGSRARSPGPPSRSMGCRSSTDSCGLFGWASMNAELGRPRRQGQAPAPSTRR